MYVPMKIAGDVGGSGVLPTECVKQEVQMKVAALGAFVTCSVETVRHVVAAAVVHLIQMWQLLLSKKMTTTSGWQ